MIGELYDGEFDHFPREDGIISKETSCVVEKDEDGNMHILSQEEVDKYLKAASGETDTGNRMDIQKFYDEYVNEIHKIDIQIAELKGKREAYTGIRLDLFNELDKDHTCHTCKHYLPGEYDGSCGSYICKNYSGWAEKEQE